LYSLFAWLLFVTVLTFFTLKANFVQINLRHAVSIIDVRTGMFLIQKAPIIITSGQSNLRQKGRISAAHERFTCFLGPTRVSIPNDISTSSAVFAQLTAESLYFAMDYGPLLSPSKLPLRMGDLDPI